MSYLFDSSNWEWVTTGNNMRFLLEGFAINLEIAAIAIVFSLIFGLLLALARISKLRVVSIPAGIWIDVWRNLPLIFVILYMAIAMPTSWRDAYEDVVPSFFPEALQSGRVLAALAGAGPLQLRRPGRDHALRHPLPGSRPVGGGDVDGAHLPAADAAA